MRAAGSTLTAPKRVRDSAVPALPWLRRSRARTRSSSSRRPTGLVTYWSASSRKPRTLSASSPRALTMITGTRSRSNGSPSAPRSRSCPGSIRSSRIRSGRQCWACVESGAAVGRHLHLVALALQVVAQAIGEVGVVLYQQDARAAHDAIPGRRRRERHAELRAAARCRSATVAAAAEAARRSRARWPGRCRFLPRRESPRRCHGNTAPRSARGRVRGRRVPGRSR